MTKLCPVCAAENPDEATECQQCHLSAGLFDLVREAIEVPPGDPAYLVKAGEVAAAVGADPPLASPPGPADLSHAARFLAMRSGAAAARATEAPAPVAPAPVAKTPELPALPPGKNVEIYRRRVDEYFRIARREGLNLTSFEERARVATAAGSREQFEQLDREMFVLLAGALSADSVALTQRRNELATVASTAAADVELSGCRQAISVGDLAGAERRLRHVETTLNDLELEWATVQILVAEAELLAETIRELGGDPGPALGPLAQGKKLARSGRREDAEHLLAKATGALWALLGPMFVADLDRLKDALVRARDRGADVTGSAAEMRSVVFALRQRNFATAVVAYRRVREFVERLSSDAVPEPAAGAVDSGSPAQ